MLRIEYPDFEARFSADNLDLGENLESLMNRERRIGLRHKTVFPASGKNCLLFVLNLIDFLHRYSSYLL